MKTRGFERRVTKLLLGLSVWLVVCILACASSVRGETTADGTSGGAVRIRKLPPPPRFTEEGFEVKRVGSRDEPVVRYGPSVFRLPGTQMTFAAYSYLTPKDDLPFPKYGFFFDDGRFFYVDEIAASHGDAQYALCNGYFIVDGLAHHGNSNRSMYLFEYNKNSVKLLDMIGMAYIADHGLDFASRYPGKPTYGHEITLGSKDTPVWVIMDRDRHSNPLIRIEIIRGNFDADLFDLSYKIALERVKGNKDPEFNRPLIEGGRTTYDTFTLYLRIVTPSEGHPKLQVALDPELYKPLFDAVKEACKDELRPVGYYTYGFLAGQLYLDQIRAEIADSKARKYIVDILENVDTWDAALHERSDEPLPKIVEYKLERR
jgi:hypothetical protein